MKMTVAGRWPIKDGGIGGVRGDVGMEGSSFAQFLGLVPKRGFVQGVSDKILSCLPKIF